VHLTYLSTDSLGEGVGFSQVFAYVTRMASRGVEVSLHSFEKEEPSDAMKRAVAAAGVEWHIHPFGRFGAIPGLLRVLRGALYVRGAALVHARSDMAAAAVLLARRHPWVWDCRSLYVDQKIELEELKKGSSSEAILRRIEAAAAKRCSAIVTLTEAVVPVLVDRFGPEVAGKVTVIPTCADLELFTPAGMPAPSPLRLMLAGTVNRYYDVPLMISLVEAARGRMATHFSVLTPTIDRPDLRSVADEITSVAARDVPTAISGVHAGLSVCRDNAGISLTASMPTKIGEFLAVGRPLVVNPGLGDAGRLLVQERCGVAVTSTTIDDCLDELQALVTDPETPGRCRLLAQRRFNVDDAVTKLVGIYEGLATND
jgi:hypothetical protein